MRIPIEKYVSAIINKNQFEITGVFQIIEIETYKYEKEYITIIEKNISAGKINQLSDLKKAENVLGEELILISFYDQNHILFYALIHSSSELSQEPELVFLDKYFLYKINEQEKNKLISTFSKLTGIEKKISFWENELGISYAEFLLNRDYYQILEDFDFSSEREQWAKINKWLIDTYQEGTFRKPISLYEFKSFKKAINEKLKTTREKLELIVDSMKEIDESFIQTNKHSSMFSMSLKPTFYNSKFQVNHDAYANYLIYSISPNLSKIAPGIEVIQYMNGETLAIYYLYLKQLLTKSKNGIPLELIEDEKLTIEQIALLLELTGFLSGCKADPYDKARVLSELLGVGEKTLYDAIRNVNSVEIRKNKKNHVKIMNFLEYVDAKALKNSVRAEIDKI